MVGLDPLRFVAFMIGTSLGVIVFVGVMWPFIGTSIRYWAHYSPKHITLGDEDRGERGMLSFGLLEDNESFNGYWSLLRRVKRVEGIGGLWRGAGLLAVFLVITIIFYIFLALVTPFLPFNILRPSPLLVSMLIIASYVVVIPIRVILIRSVTTSRQLRITQPRRAYRALLLNSFERENPFRLYLLPGIAIIFIFSDMELSVLSSLRGLVLQAFRLQNSFSLVRIILSITLNVVMALLVTPLEVIITRLSIQERYPPDPITQSVPHTVPQPSDELAPPAYREVEAEEEIEFAGAEEDVINLRTTEEPYRGLVDCAKCIVREEGMGTFWRGWPILAVWCFINEMAMLTRTW